ncbi:hypothetical protein M408DRAFT_325648 [Serendipita vermifera MAFF 305830]|uniref:GST N-terminal domain-containing protein n=1 Tax=Serendipita vermifera MAFF 305830 TaxID=933852 RepID=A0A0C3BS03_SERVB|nr:hypothetical protein M408DRAFT_325648 [Serendipita vermifera MAFF 305830]
MSKPILYRFEGSVWAAVPELAFQELGYTDEVVQERVNLMEGGNFELSYVKTSPQATLPALVTPDGQLYDSTIKVTRYLIDNAPANAKIGKSIGEEILEIVHEDKIDPNFFMVAARNPEELKVKNAGASGAFFRGRQVTLERVAPTVPPELKAFYDAKLAGNGGAIAIYTGAAPADKVEGYFKASQQNWDAVANFVTVVLPKYLPAQGFTGGDAPGEADFHIGAWLARIAAVLGAKNEKDAWKIFAAFGEVPASVSQYWQTWQARESWSVVYKGGLH